MTGSDPNDRSDLPSRHAYAEAWFDEAVRLLRPAFAEAGHPVPPVRVSVGFGDAGFRPGRRTNADSVCYPRWMSGDGVNQVFVSPVRTEPADVLRLLLHELVHAVDDCRHGHGAPFRRIAEAVGLDARGPAGLPRHRALQQRCDRIATALGPFPRAPLRLDGRPVPAESPLRTPWRLALPADGLAAHRSPIEAHPPQASRPGSPPAAGPCAAPRAG